MSASLPRRLPGVRFEVPPPALDETLPRMDIACFVGFAARGPLDRAVAVESLVEFEAVYGSGLVLARDANTRQDVRGLLHPCVRSFFSQGGRRCWVLRVAGAGASARIFPVPLMLEAQRPEPGRPWRFAPAALKAGSAGSGFDTVRVSARLEAQAVRVQLLPTTGEDDLLLLEASAIAAEGLRAGDLLRLQLHELRLHGRIDAVSGQAAHRQIALRSLCALRPLPPDSPPVLVQIEHDGVLTSPPSAGVRAEWDDAGRMHLRSHLTGVLPEPGTPVRLRIPHASGDREAWLALSRIDVLAAATPGTAAQVEWVGEAWIADSPEAELADWRAEGDERLAWALRVEVRASDELATPALSQPLRMAMAAGAPEGTPFGLADGMRFPLVSQAEQGERLWLPLGDLAGFAPSMGPRPDPRPALERDGLEDFHWSLFAEELLADSSADVLADRAEALRLVGGGLRSLRGMHALFGGLAQALVEEPTLLAIPDAVHAGWTEVPRPQLWTPLPALPQPPEEQEAGRFEDCAAEPLPVPAFQQGEDPDAEGSFTLFWTSVIDGASYLLEEAADAAFGTATLLYEGPATQFRVPSRSPGGYHYRVRATLGLRRSWWADPVRIEVGWVGYRTNAWSSTQLLAVHRLMLRCAAGRGDVLAVLALPEHFDAVDAAAHAEALRSWRANVALLPPMIGPDEGRALSHGALYHPWLVIRRDQDIVRFPPDGAVCGQLAASALQRGAWLAVAERPLRDVVALSPAGLAPMLAQRQALLDAQVNLVRSAPRGFVLSTADTLTADAPWRPINVRRLMCVLRRLALRRGTDYVFEPNGPILQRTVERGFEALLDLLFRRGAFAGARAADAYRVETGDEINTPRRRDAGQFWVELKVAPALPLSFLTVRLAREGERVISREVH